MTPKSLDEAYADWIQAIADQKRKTAILGDAFKDEVIVDMLLDLLRRVEALEDKQQQ